MTSSRILADESPDSAFIREMRDALAKRLEVCTSAEKRAVDREMLRIMIEHLGPAAWRAAMERGATGLSPVERRRIGRRIHGRSRVYGGSVDRKLAAAGPDED